MAAAISTERWAAAFALLEFEAPTNDRVATALGVHPSTLARRAARQGRALPDFRDKELREAHAEMRAELIRRHVDKVPDEPATREGPVAGGLPPLPPPDAEEPPHHRAERLASLLARYGDWVVANADAQGGVLTKQQLDTVSTMYRLATTFEEQAAESAREKQTRSDAEAAEILKRVDDRIVELAYDYARRIVARRAADTGSGACDPDDPAARLGGEESDG